LANNGKNQKSEKRYCILVLGMHRSGTSALTRVISILGARLPQNLLPPASDSNPTGFWESQELMQLHDKILQSGDSRWDDWRRFNEQWLASPEAANYRGRLTDYVMKDFADSPLFVIKDPRICRLLPLWLHVLRECVVIPLVVIPVRNPLEVALSLQVRNGFLTAKSCLLWLRHVLEAERNTRGVARCVVTYDDLLNNSQHVTSSLAKQLGLKCSNESTTIMEIEGFLNIQHRHHHKQTEDLDGYPNVAKWLNRTYKTMLTMARSGESATSRRELDDIYAEFDEVSGMFGPVLWAEQKAIRHQMMAQIRAQEESLNSTITAQGQMVQQLKAELTNNHTEIQRFKAELANNHATMQQLESQLLASHSDTEQLLRKVSEHKKEANQMLNELTQTKAEAENLRRENAAIKSSTLWRIMALLRKKPSGY
jgi:hypothetical protein